MGIEDRLRETLSRRVSGIGTDDGAWESILARVERGPRRRALPAVIAAAVAAAVAAVALALLWPAFRHEAPAPAPASAPVLSPHVTAVIPIGPWPGVIAVGEGSAWVGVRSDSGEQVLVRIDESTNQVVDRIPLEVDDLVVAFGSVWASGLGPSGGPRVSRIDPATDRVVATIDGVGGYLAAGEGFVWALTPAEGEGVLSRIDPSNNEAVPLMDVGGPPVGLAAGEGAVWLSDTNPQTGVALVKVDPLTGSVVDRIEGDIYSLAVGEGYVWIAKLDPQGSTLVVRIDPWSDAPTEPSIQWGSSFRPFDAGEGGIWIIEGPPGGICRLNADTLRDDSCVDPGDYADTGLNWSAALDTTNDTIWIANYRDTVTRVDIR